MMGRKCANSYQWAFRFLSAHTYFEQAFSLLDNTSVNKWLIDWLGCIVNCCCTKNSWIASSCSKIHRFELIWSNWSNKRKIFKLPQSKLNPPSQCPAFNFRILPFSQSTWAAMLVIIGCATNLHNSITFLSCCSGKVLFHQILLIQNPISLAFVYMHLANL